MRPGHENRVMGAVTAKQIQKDMKQWLLQILGITSIALVSLYKETLIFYFVLAFAKKFFF